MAPIACPFFKNKSRRQLLTSRQFIVRSYIGTTNRSSTGVASVTAFIVGEELSFTEVSVTSSKLCHVLHAFLSPTVCEERSLVTSSECMKQQKYFRFFCSKAIADCMDRKVELVLTASKISPQLVEI